MTKKKNALIVCSALILALLPLPAACAADEGVVLTVAFPETPGISEVYEDGTYGGSVYDWLYEIAKYTGWQYEFVTGDANELSTAMMAGTYDLMGGMYAGYDDVLHYPKYAIGSNHNLLLCRQDDPDIKSYDLTTLDGKRIGVSRRATRRISQLSHFLAYNQLNCELVYFDNVADYETCLKTGAADLMLGTDTMTTGDYTTAARFDAEPYYIVTAKDRPDLCGQLSAAMEAIYTADPHFATALYERYSPETHSSPLTFTAQEQDFIRQSGPLRVAVVTDRFPIFYERDGALCGILPECLRLITERSGLTFEYVAADSYQGMIDLVTQGKADLVGDFRNEDASADQFGLTRTVPYTSLDSVILCNKDSFDKTGGRIMAVPEGRDLLPSGANDTVHNYPTYQACMAAVSRGEADYTRMPASFVEDYYSRDYYADVSLVADTSMQEDLTLALPKTADAPLYAVLNKTLHSFTPEESAFFVTNNSLMLRERKLTLKSLLYTHPLPVLCASVGVVLLLALVVVLINLNRTRVRVMQLKLEKAEETSRAKSDFLSRMSHEIRTPMNAIIGLTNLTRMGGSLPPAADKNLAQIDSSAQFLLRLLNDVLDMSKIENRKMRLDPAPFDLAQLLEQTAGIFALQAEQQQLTLQTVCRMQQTAFVGDRMRLQQVLTNLLSNACKFTDPGGSVCLTAAQQDDGSEQTATLRFSVRDTGIGIRAQDLETIFHAFEQAKNSNQRTPGTGLGLAISSNLVELMGGRLAVESSPGHGSTFHFTISLPVYTGALAPAAARSQDDDSLLDGRRVLLAEDNDINADIVDELLRSRGCTVDRAANGLQAVDLFTQSAPGAYDAVLMDINMPVMDGLTAAHNIRALLRPDGQTVPIIAMTANTFPEDRDNALRAGMTGFLPKPFDVAQLYDILTETLGQTDNPATKDGEPT